MSSRRTSSVPKEDVVFPRMLYCDSRCSQTLTGLSPALPGALLCNATRRLGDGQRVILRQRVRGSVRAVRAVRNTLVFQTETGVVADDSVEYITVESSRLAQMNTSGQVRYALELLEIDKKSFQVLGAALQRRGKELEAESALLESMEEEAKVWKDKVKAIEDRVALRRKANAELKQLLACDQQENQSSFNRVHLGVVDSLRPG